MLIVTIFILSLISLGIGFCLIMKSGEKYFFFEKKPIKGCIAICVGTFLCVFPFLYISLISPSHAEFPSNEYNIREKYITENGRTDTVYVITKIKDYSVTIPLKNISIMVK